ncbi:MAG: hypothetical protein HOG23_06195 [Flavobacteriaceae bacterium]|jgi:hypothetical protein|nr:hypothetical protein [Flavobacteriaceae bacterium]MBT3754595.1 hypothetical protein [Flavobacteriaceae bacterium]MBT3794750.1 hypothetical protein [Flavobacteriaceae bacterium]MBT4246147.1 hypothetical protein [Flavobacteriaceae bacterium]MBT5012284.1 hypothetical protein [Flavobacteriaceae bacterium]
MALSKKEISILIEIVFSIVFAFIFLPYFYENQDNNLILMDDLIGKIIEILIFTVIYFSIAYSLLEFVFKKKEAKDERDDMINSKSYKLGYLLYEFSLFIFIGYVCSKFQNKELLNLTGNQELYNNFNLTDAGVVFLILILLAFISIVKSLYQFYLYRTV